MSVLEPLSAEEKEIASSLVSTLRKFYVGKANGKMGHEIVSGLKSKGYEKFSDMRLRKIVNWCRRNGYPICSCPNAGYFWPATKEDVLHCITSNEERANGILAANEGMKKGINKFFQ